MAEKKLQKFTTKEIKFIRAMANGKNQSEAAVLAYNAKTYGIAKSIASQNMAKPRIRDAVKAEMARQGITLADAIRPIRLALSDKELEMQLKGSDRALKLMGAHDQERDQNPGNTINFNFNSPKEGQG